MPNYCEYEMAVVGKKADRDTFLNRLKSYDEPNHFYRVFEAVVYDETTSDKNESDGVSYITGYCAWSLESCCRASGYSNGVDLFSVNTRELGLKLEAYSREPGIGFEEHYVYDNGVCLTDECLNIRAFWWDKDCYPTYEEFKNAFGEAFGEVPPEESFDESDECIVGGFGDNYGEWNWNILRSS